MRCLQDFADRFQDFEKISQTLRHVAFPHLVDTESAPFHLQMELMQLKNNEKLVAKFNQEENLIESWKSAMEYSLLPELTRETFWKHLSLRISIFNDEVLEERVSHTIVGRKFGVSNKVMICREVPDFARFSAHMQDQGSH